LKMFNSMNINASGLTAQRLRLDVISNNIANANTTRTEQGGPYRRHRVIFQEIMDEKYGNGARLYTSKAQKSQGVRVLSIEEDNSPLKPVYDPNHPDADEAGYVMMPNVNIVTEMVDMISAARSYEANITAINSAKNMISKTLEIGKA